MHQRRTAPPTIFHNYVIYFSILDNAFNATAAMSEFGVEGTVVGCDPISL